MVEIWDLPVKNAHKKKRWRTRSKKVTAIFLRKNNVPKNMERVPKWNDQERIPLFSGMRSWSFYFLERVIITYIHISYKSPRRDVTGVTPDASKDRV